MGRFAALTTASAVVLVVVALAARTFGASSFAFAFVVVWFPMVVVGVTSRAVQVRLPDRFHALRGFERSGRVYELVGIRAFKAMLRRGPLAVFNPDLHLPAERTPVELARLARRMCDAEASHAVLFVATLPVVVHAAVRGWWVAVLATVAFDLVMNGYPVMLQRYNRAKLAERFGPTT